MENIMLDPAQNRHLNDKGYVRHQLLSDSEIQSLLDEVYKYYPERAFLPNGYEASHAGITTSYTHDGVTVREHIFDVVRKILSPKIDHLLNDYRILSCGLFVKAPKGGWLDLHYHPTVVEDPRHWVIDIWCPLQDTEFFNGTFCAVPESHRIFPSVIDLSPQEPPFYHTYSEEIRTKYSVAIPAKAGEAVLFEDSLLHWSPQNMADSPRYAIHCTCIPREATAVYVYLDPIKPDFFEMYEVTDRFFIERPPSTWRDNLRLIKVLPNRNPTYTFDEFKDRLEKSNTIRDAMLL